jgi:hypothetical protein
MKITIDKAVLEQALDALEELDDYVARIEGNDRRYGRTIVAMHGALAQPAAQADPFTYIIQHLNSSPYALTKDECITKIKELRALYTNPPT